MKKSVLILAAAMSAAIAAPAVAADTLTATFTAIEQKWVDAVTKRDAATLTAIIAADWHGQNPSGKRSDRAASLASLKDMNSVLTKATVRDVHVTLLSPTIAVVQGSEDDISSEAGKDTSGAYNWTDVFEKRSGKWVAVVSQLTKVDKK